MLSLYKVGCSTATTIAISLKQEQWLHLDTGPLPRQNDDVTWPVRWDWAATYTKS